MSTARKVAILTNPDRSQLVDDVVSALDSIDSTVLEPDSASDIVECVRDAAESGADTVVAVGGDGTQRSVAAGVLGTKSTLGVVPGGTVNLLAQVLGVDELETAVAAIVDGSIRQIDVGRCNGELFLLNASSGYDAAVISEANEGNKERFGRLSFVRAAVTVFRRTRRRHVTVTADGSVVFDGDALSVIVTNVAERSSSDMIVAPDAAFDDGVLDILVIRPDGAIAALRLAAAILRGREPDRDLVRATGRDIDVVWADEVAGQIDGDASERSDRFEVRVEPGALSVWN